MRSRRCRRKRSSRPSAGPEVGGPVFRLRVGLVSDLGPLGPNAFTVRPVRRSNQAGGSHGEAAAEADQCSRGFNGGAGGRYSLQDRGCCRRQRGSWEGAGRNAVETAAGSLRDLRVAEVTKMGHESGERESGGISYAHFALLQVRRVTLWCGRSAEAGPPPHAIWKPAVCQRCSNGSKPSGRMEE
jgi:hypothetical protein